MFLINSFLGHIREGNFFRSPPVCFRSFYMIGRAKVLADIINPGYVCSWTRRTWISRCAVCKAQDTVAMCLSLFAANVTDALTGAFAALVVFLKIDDIRKAWFTHKLSVPCNDQTIKHSNKYDMIRDKQHNHPIWLQKMTSITLRRFISKSMNIFIQLPNVCLGGWSRPNLLVGKLRNWDNTDPPDIVWKLLSQQPCEDLNQTL